MASFFAKKSPMEKWRSQNRDAAAFVDHSGWDVHLDSGAVHTVIDGLPVVVLAHRTGDSRVGVIIEAGAQAERSLANIFGDDGGESFEFDGWRGVAAPGSGMIEAAGRGGPELFDKVVAAATHLVSRVR